MCEGNICKETGRSIEESPCKVGISFLNVADIQEPVKKMVSDTISHMIQGPANEHEVRAFFGNGWTGQRNLG